MHVTLNEIAERLSLSPATVSRSLRHDPLIHPATRARVNETAVAMGYQGRSRRGRTPAKTESIASMDGPATPATRRVLAVLVGAHDLSHARHNGNFMRLLEGITSECDGSSAMTSLHTLQPTANKGETPPLPEVIRERLCDAVIIAGNLPIREVERIAQLVPIVTVSRVYPGVVADCVIADNLNGVRALVARLADAGHRRLAFVADAYEASFFAERSAGFLQGCAEQGLDLAAQRFVPADAYLRGAEGLLPADTLAALVREGVTGLVCANDLTAYRAIAVLEGLGITVPDQVSVTGFDLTPVSLLRLPATPLDKTLTTVDPNFVEMGRCAVRLALQRLTHSAVPALRLGVAATIVDGNTVAAPTAGLS